MTDLSRRTMLAGAAAALPTAALTPALAQRAQPVTVLSNPPRTWGRGAPTNIYPDPDVITLDPSFGAVSEGHAVIKRIGTGYQWAEGPAWCGEGQYVVFSDVMSDIQYRYIWDSGMAPIPFRSPSLNSNGNAFDFQGRQISGQDFARRVVRWEHDGAMTVIADNFEGKPLNSPNDFACHPDGSIWFTDPLYGGQLSEGHVDQGPGPFNAGGLLNPMIGNPGSGIIGALHQVLPTQIYRWDPSGKLEVVATGQVPNGLCFSPDWKRLYFVWGANLAVADVVGSKLANIRTFSDGMIDGVKCGFDGHRCDVQGNVWSGSTAPLGYCGVTIWNPAGKAIGRIRLPETGANLTFCGPKRDWLFITASQSVYLIRTNTQGAGPF